jgi:hypothetical protein
MLRVCATPACGQLLHPDTPCPQCGRKGHLPKQTKDTMRGYHSRNWREVKWRAQVRDGFRCQQCGSPFALTAHLDPARQGDHYHATLDEVTTLCRTCHGTLDAPRATA